VNRRSDNTGLRQGLMSDISSVFLSHSLCTRSLLRSKETKAFIRGIDDAHSIQFYYFRFSEHAPFLLTVWKIMKLCFQILGEKKQVTQRELFYKLLCDSPDYFTSQTQVNRTVQGHFQIFRFLVLICFIAQGLIFSPDVVALLRCSRQSLGIMASSRGAINGRLILEAPDMGVIDCSKLGPAGHAISGDLNLLGKLVFHSDARYIIILEKDAIFQRLAEDRIFNQIPSILITAKGYPDIATRFILSINGTYPIIPPLSKVSSTSTMPNFYGRAYLGICGLPHLIVGTQEDWQYCARISLEAYPWVWRHIDMHDQLCLYIYYGGNMSVVCQPACNVKWLGLRAGDIENVSPNSMVDLRPRDLQIAKSLMSSKMLPRPYREELEVMIQKGKRVEIEALYCHGFDFLGKYISKKIVQGNYI
ncbi:hypothetical protein Taro_000851, partial [Colocasia esculenta]|nr:hypothetical protein [Colocasia esculenta]